MAEAIILKDAIVASKGFSTARITKDEAYDLILRMERVNAKALQLAAMALEQLTNSQN
jgi:hypothetical protein